MTIKLFLDTNSDWSVLGERTKSCFARAVQIIEPLLPVADAKVTVYVNPEGAIPETGIAGYSGSSDEVEISVDPFNPYLADHYEEEFIPTLGHELHHCARWGSVGYGTTLSQALVTEGLACHFERELRGGNIPFYASSLKPEELEALRLRALREQANYDHRAWFYGSSAKNIPRYAGYSLGFHVVSSFIEESGMPASRLSAEPAENFYKFLKARSFIHS